MEKLVDSGLIAGVIDVTTTEVADLLFGGVLACGRRPASAPSPAPACPMSARSARVDMVNFGALDTVPERFKGRKLYVHNPQVTLMRTTAEENARDRPLDRRAAQRLRRGRCGSCCPKAACR